EAHAGLQRDLPDALLQLTTEDFHQGGFATPIGADQAVAVTVRELDSNSFKERPGAKLNRDIRSRQHLCSAISGARRGGRRRYQEESVVECRGRWGRDPRAQGLGSSGATCGAGILYNRRCVVQAFWAPGPECAF